MRRSPILADVMAQLDYMEKRGSGLKRICNETKALNTYKEGRDPVFKSSPSQLSDARPRTRLGKAYASIALLSLLPRLPECSGAWDGGANT